MSKEIILTVSISLLVCVFIYVCTKKLRAPRKLNKSLDNPLNLYHKKKGCVTNLIIETLNLMTTSKKIDAIKFVRQETDCSLESAHNLVITIEMWDINDVKTDRNDAYSAGEAKGVDIEKLEKDCIKILQSNESPVEAIKLVREKVNISLRNAKLFVDCLPCGKSITGRGV